MYDPAVELIWGFSTCKEAAVPVPLRGTAEMIGPAAPTVVPAETAPVVVMLAGVPVRFAHGIPFGTTVFRSELPPLVSESTPPARLRAWLSPSASPVGTPVRLA